MASFLDTVPFSGIIRIRDMMYAVKDPFRLDQGDVSFDAPDTVKDAMVRAIAENKTHYVQTTGVPRLLQLIAEKLRTKNGIPIENDQDVMVTTGGIHGVYIACLALLEPGDEVIVPDPEWPPCMGNVRAAQAVPVPCPLHESLQWRWDRDELESLITPRTRAIYINSPNNPTGGVTTRADLLAIAEIAKEHALWVISDEAYEDVIFKGEHVSIASMPGMYDRTIPIYTFSKSYAMTGLRLGYFAIKDPALRARAVKIVAYTTSNVNSVAQYGGIGALEGPQDCIEQFRTELKARRDLFYAGLAEAAPGILTGMPPDGAFYAFVKTNADWAKDAGVTGPSLSWAMVEYLIKHARIGCVPGVDFGAHCEGYVRFAVSRDRKELTGALASMKEALAATPRIA